MVKQLRIEEHQHNLLNPKTGKKEIIKKSYSVTKEPLKKIFSNVALSSILISTILVCQFENLFLNILFPATILINIIIFMFYSERQEVNGFDTYKEAEDFIRRTKKEKKLFKRKVTEQKIDFLFLKYQHKVDLADYEKLKKELEEIKKYYNLNNDEGIKKDEVQDLLEDEELEERIKKNISCQVTKIRKERKNKGLCLDCGGKLNKYNLCERCGINKEFKKVTRLEVIKEGKKLLTNQDCEIELITLQDNKRTIKIFLEEKRNE